MAGKRQKQVTFNTLVRKFMRDYNIPTKKDVDRLIARIDRLEQMLAENLNTGGSGKRAGGGKAGEASTLVLEIIRGYEDGVRFSEIQQKTGFEEKKLRNIIYRLDKKGHIQRLRRGVYAAT